MAFHRRYVHSHSTYYRKCTVVSTDSVAKRLTKQCDTPTHPYNVHRVVFNGEQVPVHLYNAHDIIRFSLYSYGFTCFFYPFFEYILSFEGFKLLRHFHYVSTSYLKKKCDVTRVPAANIAAYCGRAMFDA